MQSPPAAARSSASPCRFEVTVWPQTPLQAWHAELVAADPGLQRSFDRPLELMLFLTQLPGSVPSHTGLR